MDAGAPFKGRTPRDDGWGLGSRAKSSTTTCIDSPLRKREAEGVQECTEGTILLLVLKTSVKFVHLESKFQQFYSWIYIQNQNINLKRYVHPNASS